MSSHVKVGSVSQLTVDARGLPVLVIRRNDNQMIFGCTSHALAFVIDDSSGRLRVRRWSKRTSVDVRRTTDTVVMGASGLGDYDADEIAEVSSSFKGLVIVIPVSTQLTIERSGPVTYQ